MIDISEKAKEYMKGIADAEPGKVVFLGIKGGGCAGFSYDWSLKAESELDEYSDEVIDIIVKLADRYIMDRYFPDKAVDILDEVGSYKHLTNMKIPQKIKLLEEKLIQKENAKRKAVSRQLYEVAAKERDACLTLKDKIKRDIIIATEALFTFNKFLSFPIN